MLVAAGGNVAAMVGGVHAPCSHKCGGDVGLDAPSCYTGRIAPDKGSAALAAIASQYSGSVGEQRSE
jgi:hypothetical protein